MFSLYSFPSLAFSPKPIHLYVFLGVVIQASCLQFKYYPSITDDSRPDFLFANGANLALGALQITPDSRNLPLKNLSGRVVYKDTLKLWRKNGPVIASFTTSFILNIVPLNGGGEGLAFILTNNRTCPNDSYGQWLGIVNEKTNGSSLNGIVAVEFDTRKSYTADLDDNHVGVDVNSIYSINQVSLRKMGVTLASTEDVLASIQYDGKSKIMNIYVSMANVSSSHNQLTPLISMPIDLSQYLEEDVYVGFSASTGNFTELNCLKSWNFTSSGIEKGHKLQLLWILIVIPVIIVCGGGFLCYHRRKMGSGNLVEPRPNVDIEMMLDGQTKGPRKFPLEELISATANFDRKNKLGQGGSGTVYKGFLKRTNEHVAVKRLSNESRRGEQEFISEVTTIGHLSHKNLVKLIGWCYERVELLLVYELMPKGSLDKLLFSTQKQYKEGEDEEQLSWEKRHSIICGVASALSYLHDGCRPRVFHRDVKLSNVMLDSDYSARLGDFGLARAVKRDDQTHHSTKVIAGTPGYVAPEHILTGRANAETDVYGFGVFAMVVACARPADNSNNNNNQDCCDERALNNNHIVDWLWDLYGKGKILEAVDQRLKGEFDVEQMERVLKLGLACCHSNPNERPSMKVALRVLTGEASLPDPPIERPAFIWQLGTSTSMPSMPRIVPAVTLQELLDNEVDSVH
ncbi:Protein kinase domain-containing protein [Cinnamomum micranthum f. kanehirae]|uniref:non-specific serine/threonine protein kinase n=1 Tax=Cinnamomum micranthum f. kanehirae TaxID=337451 RepID=A0A3S3MLD1_9MAGN|nr:Protein kinase domain-containing protein [Cinnamomum micranthum f. kanehirae]